MTVPASVEEVPWDDPSALAVWVRTNRNRVTPLALERLLGHGGFEDAGEMPTKGAVRCALWNPKLSEKYPELTKLAVTVYYTDVVTGVNLDRALLVIRELRRWKLLRGIALAEEAKEESGAK